MRVRCSSGLTIACRSPRPWLVGLVGFVAVLALACSSAAGGRVRRPPPATRRAPTPTSHTATTPPGSAAPGASDSAAHGAAPDVSAGAGPTPPSNPSFEVSGHRLQVAMGSDCLLNVTDPHGERTLVDVGISGPCHILEWTRPPPPSAGPGGVSEGEPVGAMGDARAYRYGNGTVAVVLIGGPVRPADETRTAGRRCGGASAAVLLEGPKVRLSGRRIEGPSNPQCVEWGGPDEREYWLFAHE